MPVDPRADPCRRAWIACPWCAETTECVDCQAGRNCGLHWRYLLESAPHRVLLECRSCSLLWWHYTQFGAGGAGRPAGLDEVPTFTPPRRSKGEAA